MSDSKDSTKNKFELDRLDHDNHSNRAEHSLVVYGMKSMPLLLNAKLRSGYAGK